MSPRALALLAGGLTAAAADPLFGIIRWDAWNDRTVDVISTTARAVMSPPKWHSRLPWFATVNPQNASDIFLDGDRQEVFDQEVKYASQAGLSFFVHDTYCEYPTDAHIPQCAGYWGGPTPTSKDYKAKDPGYALKLHQKSEVARQLGIRYSLMLLGASPATEALRPRYLALFNDSMFQRVLGDRPLVFLFQAADNEANMNGGWEAWKQQWDAFRNDSIKQGSGNPYLVATSLTYERAESVRTKLGFDAVSAYALPTPTNEPYAAQVTKAEKFWNTSRSAGVDVVPPVALGWDPTPRSEHEPPWVKEKGTHYESPTDNELAAYVASARDWIVANPAAVPSSAALMYAWNEVSENNGCLVPSVGNGTARVEAVGKVLRKGQ